MTIKDIARLAGCGVSTVSRALNGSSEISDATRARINEVIQKYNYTPNGNARRMRQTAPNSVLLIVNLIIIYNNLIGTYFVIIICY